MTSSDGKPPMPVETTILLLTYNRSDLLDLRLKELARLPLADHNAEVVVIDNGSTDGSGLVYLTAKERYRLRGQNLGIVVIEKNRGFGPGFNYGVRRTSGSNIVLLSNDVKVYGDFVEPVSRMLRDGTRSIICHELIHRPAGWNQFGSTMFPWPSGYFLAMRREVWNALDGFDERFAPCDYEDVDLGFRAARAGFDVREMPELPLEHGVAQTIGYNPERYEQTCRMRSLFAEKHGLPNVPEKP